MKDFNDFIVGKTKSEIVSSSEFQNECRRQVENEVFACASSLISTLAEDEKYFDDLYPILSNTSYRCTACDTEYSNEDDAEECLASHVIFTCDVCGHTTEGSDAEVDMMKHISSQHPKELAENESKYYMLMTEKGEGEVEETVNEALEHWIVSRWLANKLEEQGEMITHDFMGLTIWGRCTSGQAIYIDGVIERIVLDLYEIK